MTGTFCPDCDALTGGRCWRHAVTIIPVPVTVTPIESPPSLTVDPHTGCATLDPASMWRWIATLNDKVVALEALLRQCRELLTHRELKAAEALAWAHGFSYGDEFAAFARFVHGQLELHLGPETAKEGSCSTSR